MDTEDQDQDIYGLIGKVCENLLRQQIDVAEHPYLPQKNNNKHLRKLKSKAYEILLKKSRKDYGIDVQPSDPIIELLKYVFDLKVSQGCISQAAELQQYLDEFIDDTLDANSTTYSVLQFLNCLKSLETPEVEKDSLDVFYFGKPHPQVPEMLYNNKDIPPFQIYPSESFYLPQKFEKKFKEKSNSIIKFNLDRPGNASTLLNQFSICPNLEEQIGRYNNYNASSILPSIPHSTSKLLHGSDFVLNSYFIPQIKSIEGSNYQFQICQEGIVTEPETPWQNKDPLQFFENYTEISEIKETNLGEEMKNVDEVWERMDKISPVSNHRTWETLGKFEPPKEPPFASESVEATLHLINIAEDSIFTNQSQLLCPIKEISSKEFIKHIKLLLLGVESSTFIYNKYTGFELQKNIIIHGVGPGTLENVCEEVTRYGTYHRKLSELIVTDPETEKFKVDGLIFKALCSSLKEFLLFFHAAILKVTTTRNHNDSLLAFLHKIRPLGNLIFKVAELVQCESQRENSLGEGICILTHIYKEVTKVTEQNVALVFYSILKECCEVYFRFLQQWIFEGLCVDIYEEFMVKVRPQYTRVRGHRFWTRAFTINKESVPGFLSELTDTILQCGKAVALLRICDPKNPLCQMSATSQPPVRVCLSVGMLREQAKFYEDYLAKGIAEQGEELSLCSAITEQKEAEKHRAELVMAAQKDTLVRLKKEREEALLKISKEKSELLEQLKSQAEEAVQRRERDRDAEIAADKIFLENFAKNEIKAKLVEQAAREKTLNYYNELAVEVERRRAQSEQPDQKLKSLADPGQEKLAEQTEVTTEPKIQNEDDSSDTTKKSVNKEFENKDQTENSTKSSENQVNLDTSEESIINGAVKEIVSADENSNPAPKNMNDSHVKNSNINININVAEQEAENRAEQTSTKAVRPTALDIIGISTQNNVNDADGSKNTQKPVFNLPNLKETDNMTAAQRNKLKVLQQEYGVSPNNNESATILSAIEKSAALTETQINRNRNTQHYSFSPDDTENQPKSTDENNEQKTEIELNRLRNTQHLTGFNLNEPGIVTQTDNQPLNEAQRNRNKIMSHFYTDEPETVTMLKTEASTDWLLTENQPLTEAQRNRNKVMSHFYTDESEPIAMSKTEASIDWKQTENQPLTEAQRNRNKVMSHFYTDEPEPIAITKIETLTDWQRNRNHNMAHSTGQFDYENVKNVELSKETPMSTTTDYFTVSTNSGSLHIPSCENTPLTENNNSPSELMFGRSSDGMSTDDMSPSRSFKHFRDTPSYPNFIGFGSALTTPSHENQQLTAADVKMIDSTSLEVYLEKSVVIPLIVQSRLVNTAVIKHFLKEHKMLSHLHSLRSFFFLLNGEFAKSLTQSLFTRLYKVSSPVELFNSTTLSNFLDNALVSSLSTTYTNSELLSLSATNPPAYLQTSNPEILNCLSLNYKMSWPLNIIFNDIVMQQYSKVFKFLLMVGRVLWVLEEDFQILKTARKHVFVQNRHKLQLYRHSMMQFMNALHTYLTCSVLHASWSEFEKELENATTLDELNSIHVSYIKKILSRCMLNASGETMRTCLCNIFKVVLKFHNRIRAQDWSSDRQSAGPNYENLEKMYIAFCEQRAYLARLANKLANSGYQPHLMQFLHALNINHRYDLAVKK